MMVTSIWQYTSVVEFCCFNDKNNSFSFSVHSASYSLRHMCFMHFNSSFSFFYKQCVILITRAMGLLELFWIATS